MGAAQAFHGCCRISDINQGSQSSSCLLVFAYLLRTGHDPCLGNLYHHLTSLCTSIYFTFLHHTPDLVHISHLYRSLFFCFLPIPCLPALTHNRAEDIHVLRHRANHIYNQSLPLVARCRIPFDRMLAQEQRECEPPGTLLFSVFQTRPGSISLHRTD